MKRIAKIFLCLLLAVMFIPSVKAEDARLAKYVAVVKTEQTTSNYQELKDLLGITIEYDDETSSDTKVVIKLTDTENNVERIPFDYADGILTYTIDQTKKDSFAYQIEAAFAQILILESALLNSGYTADEVERIMDADNVIENAKIDVEGIEVEEVTEHFEDENSSGTTTYLKSMKVKIDGIKVKVPEIVIPTIQAIKGDEGVVSLKVSTPNPSDNSICYIYRSTTEDYEIIGTTECNSTYVDKTVEKGQIYFYKVSKDKKNLSSPVITKAYYATTGDDSGTPSTNQPVSNPKTGVYDHVIELVAGIVIAGLLLATLKKKELFKRL